jgi:hypothetical protein
MAWLADTARIKKSFDAVFGKFVALSDSTIVLGAQGSDINGDADHCSAHVFGRGGGGLGPD